MFSESNVYGEADIFLPRLKNEAPPCAGVLCQLKESNETAIKSTDGWRNGSVPK